MTAEDVWREDGPTLACARVLTAVYDEADLAAAWAGVDEPFRLANAQAFLAGVDRFGDDAAAARLAAADTSHDEWHAFSAWVIDACRGRGLYSAATYGAIPEQIITPGLAYVFFAYTGGESIEHESGEQIVGMGWLMRHDGERWLLAGSGRYLPKPGWPPSREGPLPVEGHRGGLPPIIPS